jgi:hypothetical protein
MNVSPFVKYTTFEIAKGLAPYDTGNLRHNAIRMTKIKEDSWTINYDTQQAIYISYLEEGTETMKARKFIHITAMQIAVYLKRTLQGKRPLKVHRKIMDNSIDEASNEERLQRMYRSINSVARYELRNEQTIETFRNSIN